MIERITNIFSRNSIMFKFRTPVTSVLMYHCSKSVICVWQLLTLTPLKLAVTFGCYNVSITNVFDLFYRYNLIRISFLKCTFGNTLSNLNHVLYWWTHDNACPHYVKLAFVLHINILTRSRYFMQLGQEVTAAAAQTYRLLHDNTVWHDFWH